MYQEVPDVQKVRFAVLGPMRERVSPKQEATDEVISVAPTVIHALNMAMQDVTGFIKVTGESGTVQAREWQVL
jgi:hypothetical protein